MTASELIREHIKKYSYCTFYDLLKLSIQASFGAAHFKGTKEDAICGISSELSHFESSHEDEAEEKLEDFVRLNLKAPYVRETGTNALASLFYLSACEDFAKIYETSRLEKLTALISEAEMQLFDVSTEEKKTAHMILEAYRSGKAASISHSTVYREKYNPSYRVLSRKYSRLLPIIHDAINLSKMKSSVIIAIDGPCTSGKTTAAQIISEILDADIISSDDFFLPFDKKTPERLATPGGNTDSERFSEEISPHLKDPSPFTYNAYSCSTGTYNPKPVSKTKFIIVEGVYTMLPQFRKLYDIRVWFDVSSETQIKRLTERDPQLLERFVNEWIPMEESYFSTFRIKENCHIIIEE